MQESPELGGTNASFAQHEWRVRQHCCSPLGIPFASDECLDICCVLAEECKPAWNHSSCYLKMTFWYWRQILPSVSYTVCTRHAVWLVEDHWRDSPPGGRLLLLLTIHIAWEHAIPGFWCTGGCTGMTEDRVFVPCSCNQLDLSVQIFFHCKLKSCQESESSQAIQTDHILFSLKFFCCFTTFSVKLMNGVYLL